MLDHESSLPSQTGLEMERKKKLPQQLKQPTDSAARLRDKWRRSKSRERQLQMKLDETKSAMSKLQLHTNTYCFNGRFPDETRLSS